MAGGPFVLRAASGVEVHLLAWGATVQRLLAPDREGRAGDVVLGFDDPARYRGDHPHLGCVVGRSANRIAHGRAVVDGRELALTRNLGGVHHLHGGAAGLHHVEWEAEPCQGGVRFGRSSPDGEEGYPGNARFEVVYRLDDQGALSIEYGAESDAPTPVNLSQHAYFHLGDGGASPIAEHWLEIAADTFTPTDADFIPTGELAPVAGTALDFRRPRRVGDGLAATGLEPPGYDHDFVLRGGVRRADDPAFAARLVEPASGRSLEVWTTQPGLQLYTGNHLDGSLVGRGGVAYRRWHGLCLESQHLPDAPNHPGFPTTVLRPGERYAHTTVWRFGRDG
jgi:aldose 1-epimerase